ncbi:MAG: phosphoribosylformylglycinamidine cyclo-ligase [Spirochaetes bacterium]|nr:phosphoribosylformylglycinamidine cyclo-ligase [Spirochaetota bacterium]
MGLTYKDSGVDIRSGEMFVDLIRRKLKKEEAGNIGGFGGTYDLGPLNISHPVLVASTDGVGTKLAVAREAGRYGTIGIDLVAMCVNDVVCTGAKPIFFLDYIATSRLDLDEAGSVMDGIVEGCRMAGCVLLGGETAEMPGIYKDGDYELAGFACGISEKNRLIDTGSIIAGDVLVGIRSSGIHSNGMSLARKALFEKGGYDLQSSPAVLGRSIARELLEPTRIYVDVTLETIEQVAVHGVAHITGGGLYDNLKRLLPDGLDINIRWDVLSPQPVFGLIQAAGEIDDEEMRNTFNLGVGLVFIVPEKAAPQALQTLKTLGEAPLMLGNVVPRR